MSKFQLNDTLLYCTDENGAQYCRADVNSPWVRMSAVAGPTHGHAYQVSDTYHLLYLSCYLKL